MGEMVYFFEANKNELFRSEDSENTDYILECMKNYYKFDRNGFFHKHNIEDYAVVDRIKNNTYILLYWLLGKIKLSGNDIDDMQALGVVDDTFDRLYRKVAYSNCVSYIVRLTDNGEEKRYIRLFSKPNYTIDDDGYINDAKLEFVEVDVLPSCPQEYMDMLKSRIKSEIDLSSDKYKDYTLMAYYCVLGREIEEKDRIIIDKSNVPRKVVAVDYKENRTTVLEL